MLNSVFHPSWNDFGWVPVELWEPLGRQCQWDQYPPLIGLWPQSSQKSRHQGQTAEKCYVAHSRPGWYVSISLGNTAGNLLPHPGTGNVSEWLWMCGPQFRESLCEPGYSGSQQGTLDSALESSATFLEGNGCHLEARHRKHTEIFTEFFGNVKKSHYSNQTMCLT